MMDNLKEMGEFFVTKSSVDDKKRWEVFINPKDAKDPLINFSLFQNEWENLISALQATMTNDSLGWNGVGYCGIDISEGRPMVESHSEITEELFPKYKKGIKKRKKEIKEKKISECVTLFFNRTNVFILRESFFRFREYCLIQNAKLNK